jgi:hypothetical protein
MRPPITRSRFDQATGKEVTAHVVEVDVHVEAPGAAGELRPRARDTSNIRFRPEARALLYPGGITEGSRGLSGASQASEAIPPVTVGFLGTPEGVPERNEPAARRMLLARPPGCTSKSRHRSGGIASLNPRLTIWQPSGSPLHPEIRSLQPRHNRTCFNHTPPGRGGDPERVRLGAPSVYSVNSCSIFYSYLAAAMQSPKK